MVLAFAKRYLNDSYSITLFVNMNRLKGAEIELNEMLKTSKELIVMLNFIRLKNMLVTVYIKTLWLKKARKKMLLLKNSKKNNKDSEAILSSDIGIKRDSTAS